MIYIILATLGKTNNTRWNCEEVTNVSFDTCQDALKALDLDKRDTVYMYELNDFMDMYNNEELDELNTFMTYVNIKEK